MIRFNSNSGSRSFFMPNFSFTKSEIVVKKNLCCGNKTLQNGGCVKLPAIKDTWRWRSRARKNHIGMYRM